MEIITQPSVIAALFVGNTYGNRAYPSDFGEAAEYASWKPEHVAEVIAMDEGANDGANWLMVVKLKDGRFSFLSAGCDYTGWDCQAGGSSQEYESLDELIRMGLGQDDRDRLDMPLPG